MLSLSRLLNLGPLGLLYVERRAAPTPPAWTRFDTWITRGERTICAGRFTFIHTPRQTMRRFGYRC